MDLQKEQVLRLLEQNIFLPEEKRVALKEAIKKISPEKLIALQVVLEKGLEKQTQLFLKAHKKNPHLFSDIRNMIRGKEKAVILDAENIDRAKEQREISELEAQIDSLFE